MNDISTFIRLSWKSIFVRVSSRLLYQSLDILFWTWSTLRAKKFDYHNKIFLQFE